MSSQHTHICHKDSLTPTAAAGCDCGEKLLRPADYCHCHRDWGAGAGWLPLPQSCEGEIRLSRLDRLSLYDDAKVGSQSWKISYFDGKQVR